MSYPQELKARELMRLVNEAKEQKNIEETCYKLEKLWCELAHESDTAHDQNNPRSYDEINSDLDEVITQASELTGVYHRTVYYRFRDKYMSM